MLTLLAVALVLAPPQQSSASTIQISTGSCSPNIANVVGNVTITCKGVDPQALQTLNAELSRKKLQLADKIREANQWAARYKELESRLDEAKDDSALSRKAEKYLHEGRLKEAGEILDQIIVRGEKGVDRTAANQYNRGLVSELQFQSLDAIKHFQLAYQYRPLNCKYALEYGKVLLERGDYQAGQPVITSSVEIAKKLSNTDPNEGACLNQLLNNLGLFYQIVGRSQEAENAYTESLDGYYALSEAERGKYFPLMSALLNNLGILYVQTFRFRQAEAAFKGCLDIARKLAGIEPAAYKVDVAETLSNLGSLYIQQNRLPEAEGTLNESVSIYSELASNNPGAYNPSLASAVMNLGNLFQVTGRNAEAENNYQRAVDLCQGLGGEDPSSRQHTLALAMVGLANVYRDTQRLQDAERTYLVALRIDRDLVKISPSAYEPDLAMVLGHLGKFYVVAAYRLEQGVVTYQESLDIYRRLIQVNPARLQDQYAEALDGLGYAYSMMGNIQDARNPYSQALGIVQELSGANPDLFDRKVELHLRTLAGLDVKAQRMSDAKSEIERAIAIGQQRAASGDPKARDDLAKELIVGTMVTDDCSLAATATKVAVDEGLKEDSTTKFLICMMRHDPNIPKRPMYFDPSRP